ncbi:acyl-CoA N-acyltransferase [Parathielavia hyrcaniae]|uniref:Acyl-CoA N-acyltransferase n=1 Tax=Parathielavia hyrcaniae TaxID=113614 RepID=A0AAN6PYP1_9PEZI|nr:acyl-CoA N-acyltransferase [Parathielavia hyrcaniae]
MPARLKRKRPPGELDQPVRATTITAAAPPSPSVSRRTTRQSLIPPLPAPKDPEPRRRRRRRPEPDGQPAGNPQVSSSPRGKENMPVHAEPPHEPAQDVKMTPPSTRLSRYKSSLDAPAVAPHLSRPSDSNVHRPKSASIPTSAMRFPISEPDAQRATARPGRRPSKAIDPFIPHQSVSLGRNKPIIMTTSVVQSSQNPASNSNGATTGTTRGADSAAMADRNIDKVVLGDICFRAWYTSYYGKEMLGDFSCNGSTKGGKVAKTNGSRGASQQQPHDGSLEANGGTAHGRRDRDNHLPMLDRLYVCPSCFKYSKELLAWWEHVRWCERRGVVPGRKIYTHPKGKRTVLVPSGPPPKQGRGKRGHAGQKMVEEVVQDEGEWSIWEVDGEKDVLFCQNLSLFAKLFLDNKSVFFDVTGFNYFLLVYTPPAQAATPTPTNTAAATDPATASATTQPRSQVVGFFSKEKISWDNNNLACILVFPPWQRKGLGSLLMGVSYEISRREGLLGGPEKPISDLGKKGYKRYWAGEIARWLVTLEPQPQQPPPPPPPPPPSSSSSSSSSNDPEDQQGGGDERQQKESVVVVDIETCSRATWIAPDDCLLVLREMGVAEDAGTGPAPPLARQFLPLPRAREEPKAAAAAATPGEENINNEAAAAAAVGTPPPQPQSPPEKMVPRVRISQAAVRAWVAANKISLEPACDPDGFVEGYAIKGGGNASSLEEVV